MLVKGLMHGSLLEILINGLFRGICLTFISHDLHIPPQPEVMILEKMKRFLRVRAIGARVGERTCGFRLMFIYKLVGNTTYVYKCVFGEYY